MTSKTPHLNLNAYNTITDASAVLVFDYIDSVSGAKDGQNLYIIDEFSGSISACMVKVTACVVTLGTPTGVTSGSYNVVSVDTLGRVTGGSIVAGIGMGLYNKSGSLLEAGTVVVYDTNYDMAFNVSSSTRGDGNPAVCGVLYADAANNTVGSVLKSGVAKVFVSGSVYRGDWLIASASPGRATDSLQTKRPTYGAVGIALEASPTAYGAVMTDLNIQPYTAATGLILLSGSASGSFVGVTTYWNHTCTTGTDLLIVRLASNLSPISVMYNSQPMTLQKQAPQTSPAFFLSLYYLKNPPVGLPYVLSVQTATSGRMTLYANNFIGSAAVPIRSTASYAGAALTNIIATPLSAEGDIVMDFARIGSSAWTPSGAFQTATAYTPYESIYTSVADGQLTSTPMSWTGVSASGVIMAFSVANS